MDLPSAPALRLPSIDGLLAFAAEPNISASAVSKRISALEDFSRGLKTFLARRCGPGLASGSSILMRPPCP